MEYRSSRLCFRQSPICSYGRLIWSKLDKELDFPSTVTFRLLEFDPVEPPSQIRHFAGWRLCRYLPLLDDDDYITGCTMYCDNHSITGMVTNGKSSKMIGYRLGCPIHLCFHSGEHITSVWARLPHDPFSLEFETQPTLLVCLAYSTSCATTNPYL